MQQMCSRMIAHRGLPDVGIDDSVHPVTHANCLLGDDLMGTHPLDRRIASLHFGYDGVVIIAVEPSPVAYLSAGLAVCFAAPFQEARARSLCSAMARSKPA